ncbi:F0F1 ATP synthase subunit A [Algisphaera agarilytica]|uniref:ATP synthase subunit a n=1 Tax=Algisphaera agarilytica TaxID=1385975 RepID=A0A7X0H6Y7_9BACT|nr:F0F1 ATP synthase subunit A [Algisphaera agarilytica]MBB6430415.1 F-type H+-transporting ATPase subunit a [Algisphaera agarilytica]
MLAPILAAAESLPATEEVTEKKLEAMSHVLPYPVFDSTWFTNHHFVSLVALVLGILILKITANAMPVASGTKAEDYVTRGRLAQLIETICVFLRDEMTRPLLGNLTDKYIKLVWSFFFFILLGNLLGLIPIGSMLGLTLNSQAAGHLWGTYTGNINFTAGLAIIALLMMVVVGLKENGMGFVAHMWPVPTKAPEGTPGYMIIPITLVLWAVGILVFCLELAGYFIKSFALCIRLFANMVAGHLVLGSLIILAVYAGLLGRGISVVGAAVFSFLELFVAFLQAYIFAFLLVIFTSLGAVHHDEHDEHEAGLDEGEMPGDAVGEGLTGTASSH